VADNERAASFLQMIRRSERGKLKIYLGYAAGVGKTYRMLEEGHRLKGENIDVVVGVVEHHGRKFTQALIEGLEVVPRRQADYRGLSAGEMDLDAILSRRPQVVLVDELAHTNLPGSRHSKRYQDVQEILAAGIHVVSTMNIQHLESLYHTVEQATGVKVRERVPDLVLTEADEVVNIDLAAEDLLKRLKEGHVYPAERVNTALQNFFKAGNLEQLRELTLRELASQIDHKRREVAEEIHKGADQLMVALSSRVETHASLLRYASRLAGRLNRNWYAVYVQTPDEAPTLIDSQTQRLLADTLTLANQLGAVVFTVKGEDVAMTLRDFSRRYRVGHVILGHPRKRSFFGLFQPKPVVDQLLEGAPELSVIVVGLPEVEAPASVPGLPSDMRVLLSPGGTQATPRLSSLLDASKILIVEQSLSHKELIERLVTVALQGTLVSTTAAQRAVLEREEKGSTFLNEGLALPHASLEELASPRVAVALLRQPIRGMDLAHPVEAIFLLLTPAEASRAHLELLSVVGRAYQSLALRTALKAAGDAQEALEDFLAWERSQEAR
jgi:two-component system sensor histidine kinase KdpD